jgi:hypothetical protein
MLVGRHESAARPPVMSAVTMIPHELIVKR